VIGWSWGADDYVTKPFSPRDLVARARAFCAGVPATPSFDEDLPFWEGGFWTGSPTVLVNGRGWCRSPHRIPAVGSPSCGIQDRWLTPHAAPEAARLGVYEGVERPIDRCISTICVARLEP